MADPPVIALVHATPVAMAPIRESFQDHWPEAETFDLLESKLSVDAARDNRVEPFFGRFRTLSRYAVDVGADAVLFTCSAFGAAIEQAARDLAPIPVLKPNEAMFRQALTRGCEIGMLATFEPALAEMQREFDTLRAALNPAARLTTIVAEGAIEAARRGDVQRHNHLCAQAAADLGHCDIVMLAHFSTAQARPEVSDALARPVLTSPTCAIDELKQRLQTRV